MSRRVVCNPKEILMPTINPNVKSLLIGLLAVSLPKIVEWATTADWGEWKLIAVPLVGAVVNWLQNKLLPKVESKVGQ